jgi:hypothetical protein
MSPFVRCKRTAAVFDPNIEYKDCGRKDGSRIGTSFLPETSDALSIVLKYLAECTGQLIVGGDLAL